MDPHPEYDPIERVVRSVQAPAALRERISAERDRTLVRRTIVRRMKLAGALSACAAVLGVGAGLLAGDRAPSALDAAAFASARPEAAAPPVDQDDPAHLRRRVGGVAFPSWERHHWYARGERSDEIDGREARTVFYDDRDGVRVGYTIVEGELEWPEGAREQHGVRLLRQDGRVLAFWRVRGETCIVSAPATMSEARLLGLVSAYGVS